LLEVQTTGDHPHGTKKKPNWHLSVLRHDQ